MQHQSTPFTVRFFHSVLSYPPPIQAPPGVLARYPQPPISFLKWICDPPTATVYSPEGLVVGHLPFVQIVTVYLGGSEVVRETVTVVLPLASDTVDVTAATVPAMTAPLSKNSENLRIPSSLVETFGAVLVNPAEPPVGQSVVLRLDPHFRRAGEHENIGQRNRAWWTPSHWMPSDWTCCGARRLRSPGRQTMQGLMNRARFRPPTRELNLHSCAWGGEGAQDERDALTWSSQWTNSHRPSGKRPIRESDVGDLERIKRCSGRTGGGVARRRTPQLVLFERKGERRGWDQACPLS